jgi:hypothetical protein
MLGWSNVAETMHNLITEAIMPRVKHPVLEENHAPSSRIRNAARSAHISGAKCCPICRGTGEDNAYPCTACKGMGRS